MKSYSFTVRGFDELLCGATEQQQQEIINEIEAKEIPAKDEAESFEKLCEVMGGQELYIQNERSAYFEIFDFATGIYVDIAV